MKYLSILLFLISGLLACTSSSTKSTESVEENITEDDKISINSIHFPNFSWEKVEDFKDRKIWVNPSRTQTLSIHFFRQVPDLPSPLTETTLREYYQKSSEDGSFGLICAEIVNLSGLKATKTIFKIPNENGGIQYVSSYILPFQDCSFVIKMNAVEEGATGMRESIIANDFMLNGDIEKLDKEWRKNPYFPDSEKGFLMTEAEKEKYDEKFPKHPLSLSRKWLEELQTTIKINKEVFDLDVFRWFL